MNINFIKSDKMGNKYSKYFNSCKEFEVPYEFKIEKYPIPKFFKENGKRIVHMKVYDEYCRDMYLENVITNALTGNWYGTKPRVIPFYCYKDNLSEVRTILEKEQLGCVYCCEFDSYEKDLYYTIYKPMIKLSSMTSYLVDHKMVKINVTLPFLKLEDSTDPSSITNLTKSKRCGHLAAWINFIDVGAIPKVPYHDLKDYLDGKVFMERSADAYMGLKEKDIEFNNNMLDNGILFDLDKRIEILSFDDINGVKFSILFFDEKSKDIIHDSFRNY